MEPNRRPAPDWARLNVDPDWQALWTSPHSVVFKEIERLEARLHDTNVTDPDEITGIKHRIAALRWLRDTVHELSTPRPAPARKQRWKPSRLKTRVTDLFNRVTPPSFG